MNYPNVIITTSGSSDEEQVRRLNWILDMMEKEHHHATTHSQRNAYQAVIRHELEIMRDLILYARHETAAAALDDVTNIPY